MGSLESAGLASSAVGRLRCRAVSLVFVYKAVANASCEDAGNAISVTRKPAGIEASLTNDYLAELFMCTFRTRHVSSVPRSWLAARSPLSAAGRGLPRGG